METRIKKVEFADGSIRYMPQYKYNIYHLLKETAEFPPLLFFWCFMWVLLVIEPWTDFGSGKGTPELSVAKEVIDTYLESIEDYKKARLARKVKSKSYIKHP